MKHRVHILSNTHWDREWYMPHEKYLVRLVELCDRLIALMEAQEEYIFIADGQYSMIDDYLTVRPENRARVEKLVSEGRLEVGPWFTQPLQTLASGESLIRNLHYGIEGSEKLGRAMRFSYEIDEFGHASQMPQIYRGFGIEGAMAWRGVPVGSRSAFRWEAPDGSAVFMLYSNWGYGEATALPSSDEDFTEVIDGKEITRSGLNNRIAHLVNMRERFADTDVLFWLNGIDHSFAQPDILDVIKKINESFPELTVKQTTIEEYFDVLRESLERDRVDVKTVRGELMYTAEEILESTHSCHTRQKTMHYKAERYLDRVFEPTLALSRIFGGSGYDWAAKRAWKYVLENHAHDTLGCTSVDAVFREAMDRYEKSLALAEQTAEGARRGIMARMSGEQSLVIFNTSPFDYSGVCEFTLDIPEGYGRDDFTLSDENGSIIPHRILSSVPMTDLRYNPRTGHPTTSGGRQICALLSLESVPAFGWCKLCINKGAAVRGKGNRQTHFLAVEPAVMENENLICRINANGTFDLTDKRTGITYPSQLTLEDQGEAETVYQFVQPISGETVYSSGASAEIKLLYDTPLGAAYEVKYTLMVPESRGVNGYRSEHYAPIDVMARLKLRAGAVGLECELTLDNHAKDHRLRALFPTYITDCDVSRGGQPFDIPERGIHEPEFTPGVPEQPYSTHPMQDICDVSGKKNGMMIAAEGIYEYECIDDGSRALALTVLRSNNTISHTFGTSGQYDLKEAQNICKVSHRFALIPHCGDWKRAYPSAISYLTGVTATLNRAPEESVLVDYKAPEQTLPASGSPIKVSGENLIVTALKNAYNGEGIILRILNYGDSESCGQLKAILPGLELKDIYTVSLDEKRREKLDINDNSAVFTVKGHGLITLELVFPTMSDTNQ